MRSKSSAPAKGSSGTSTVAATFLCRSSSFVSAFSSALDKCAVTDAFNSSDNSASNIGQTRGGITSNIGTSTNGTFRALSASEIQFYSNFGSDGNADGGARDFIAHYVMVIGDLA